MYNEHNSCHKCLDYLSLDQHFFLRSEYNNCTHKNPIYFLNILQNMHVNQGLPTFSTRGLQLMKVGGPDLKRTKNKTQLNSHSNNHNLYLILFAITKGYNITIK